MKKNIFILGLIFLLFLLTRFVKIAEIPASLYWDEASIGYNAYSVATDFKDEWGEFLPFHFRAFGEFKLPVYIYSVALLVKLFGLNVLSVRLPAVLFSLGTLVFTYLLAKKISGKENIGLLSAFFLAVSPWLFIFSRTGYEATAGLMFFVLGVYFFILSLEKKEFLLGSSLGFILSIYSYNSFRVIVPIFIVFAVVYLIKEHRKSLNQMKFVGLIALAMIIISIIPIIRLFYLDVGAVRLRTVGVSQTREILTNYTSHFSLNFLLKGDANPRSQQPGFGQLWLIDLPLLLFGLVSVVKSRKKLYLLPLFLVLIAPIPASITKESPHALRSITAVPFLAIIWAFGVTFLTKNFKKFKTALIIGVIILSLASFENYSENFFRFYNSRVSQDWQYGYKKLFVDYRDEFGKYDKVIVSDQYAQPYIFALYYLKYPSEEFRQGVEYNPVDNWGFSTAKSFSNFEFKEIELADFEKDTLIFSDKERINRDANDKIEFLNGETAFWVYIQR